MVELHDLELCQQEFSERQRRWVDLESLGKWDRVAHLERSDEDVYLAAVRLVVEEQPTGSVRGKPRPGDACPYGRRNRCL